VAFGTPSGDFATDRKDCNSNPVIENGPFCKNCQAIY